MYFSLRDTSSINNPPCVKFLGIYLDQRLTWYNHVDMVCNKISSSIYVLRNLSKKVSRPVLVTEFHALIQSKISYAILAWGHASHVSRVFALQRRAVRILSGLNYRDSCVDKYIQMRLLSVPSIYIYIHINRHYHAKSYMLMGIAKPETHLRSPTPGLVKINVCISAVK